MFKLLVLACAVAACAADPKPEPGALLSGAYYASPYLATSYAARPLLAAGYSAPLYPGYGYSGYPGYSGYVAPAAHFIKKRSAPLLPYAASYIAPTTYSTYAYSAPASYSYSYSAPHYTSTYAAPIVASAPVAAPVAYSHFIKKRSAPIALPLATSYIAPAAISHQSRIDYKTYPYYSYGAPFAYTGAYAAPYAYSAYPYFYKK
ncbi:cuticle protein 16.5 [Plutella xylostella]|uniref:cuticle protein 16.5 n=1 Tax=Plutella xylostella TaxID=51655 RepID=UPI002032230A|nr:cuticle protein 16.5 [Plutella xylostella]